MRLFLMLAFLGVLSACWEEDTGLTETGETDTDTDADSDTDSDTGTEVGNEIDIQLADAKILGEEKNHPIGGYGTIVDINNDGINDIGVVSGVVSLFNSPLKGEMLFSSADVVLEVEDNGGLRLAAGDVSGDGIDDIIVGVCGMDDPGAVSTGGAYVANGPLSGNMQLEVTHSTMLYGENKNDSACRVNSADMNGDGVGDLVIGASYYDELALNAGAVYLIYGPVTSGGIEDADAKLLGEKEDDSVGSRLSTGDVDGDGVDDILMSAISSVYLMYGPAYGSISLGNADIIFSEDSTIHSGPVGDVSGDGYSDVFIESEIEPEGGLFIFNGPLVGDYSLNDAEMSLICNEEDCGNATTGDLDGDGVMEIVIGDSFDRPTGEVYVSYKYVEGSVSVSDYAFKYVGDPEYNEILGSTVLIGDLDGDSLGDLVIGDYQDNHNAESAGALYLMYASGFQDLL